MSGATVRKKQMHVKELNLRHINLILNPEEEISKIDYIIPGTIRLKN